MILIFQLFLINILFLNFIKCDIPVHCLSRHVEGKWEIHLGLLKKKKNSKQKNVEGVILNDKVTGGNVWNISGDIKKNETTAYDNNYDNNYDYQCGYKRPDNADYHDDLNPENEDTKERFEEKEKRYIVFNEDRSLNILNEEGDINSRYSGYWKIIYDEGLYIEVYKEDDSKEVYFSFFKFKQKGDVSYSYCNNLIMGVMNKYSLDNNIWDMRYEENIEENIRSDDKNNNIHMIKDEKKSVLNIDEKNREISNNISHIYMIRKNVTFFGLRNNKIKKPKRKKMKDKIIISKGNNNINEIQNDDNYNKIIKEKNFFQLIDYYNDNYISSGRFNIDKFCWYGKKVQEHSEQPTNKIPVQNISPLSVNADEYNKLYDEKKKIINNLQKSQDDQLSHSSLLLMNRNNKYEKRNSLFYKYIDKNIDLKNFDWNNKEDIKMRLGHYIKILDDAIDQKDCGSCYANSASFIINSRVRIKYNYIKNIDSLFFSNEQLILCDIFNQGCNGGYIYLSLKYAYENYLYTQKCFEKYKKKINYNTDDLEIKSSLMSQDDNSLLCDQFDVFKIKNEKKKNNEINIKEQITMNINNDSNKNQEYTNNDHDHLLILSYQIQTDPNKKDDNKKNINIYGLNEDYILIDEQKYNNNHNNNDDDEEYDIFKSNSCDVKINVSKFEYLDIQDEELLKKYIYYNGPVAAAIEPSSEFIGYKKGIILGNFIKMYDGTKNNAYIWNKVDHAVVIVGWGEDTLPNFVKKNKLSKETMEHILTTWKENNKDNGDSNNNGDILNSWGTNWGNSGYFYILRNNNSFNIKSYILACDVNLFVKQKET
ncbi:hypothetical protein PFNF54_00655 [Plasmodium falciparum NF54]|uniref:Dipeptidyl peptidase 1 n=1 Tax=Plasmodium falciparum (isolate NF54) TaxID=5843 RepID=W7K0W0_PLAFO|nr:hypothetical protein PFNF54_00655 [Plasmodium falciparum NF54]